MNEIKVRSNLYLNMYEKLLFEEHDLNTIIRLKEDILDRDSRFPSFLDQISFYGFHGQAITNSIIVHHNKILSSKFKIFKRSKDFHFLTLREIYNL